MFFIFPVEFKQPAASSRAPLANAMIVAANVVVFCLGLSWDLAVGPNTGVFSIFTYGFAHGSVWHLAGNMWLLLVFGNPVNRRLGNGWYLAAYFGTLAVLGLFARQCIGGYLLGASGGIFAVIMIALLLLPAARIELAYLALFPITLLMALYSRPKEWHCLLIRWGKCSVLAVWALFFVPLMELWSLFWSGWNWTNAGHLLGMFCGIAVVLMLPTRISMPRRATLPAIVE